MDRNYDEKLCGTNLIVARYEDLDTKKFQVVAGLAVFYKIIANHLGQLKKIRIEQTRNIQIGDQTYPIQRITENCGQNFILRFPDIVSFIREYNMPADEKKWCIHLDFDSHQMTVHGEADSNFIYIMPDKRCSTSDIESILGFNDGKEKFR